MEAIGIKNVKHVTSFSSSGMASDNMSRLSGVH